MLNERQNLILFTIPHIDFFFHSDYYHLGFKPNAAAGSLAAVTYMRGTFSSANTTKQARAAPSLGDFLGLIYDV